MIMNDVTFGHSDFVNFARFVGYGVTDPLTVFSREGEFSSIEIAKDIKKRLLYVMESLNAKEGKWNPSEHHFYRVAEAFKHYTQDYIDKEHATNCTRLIRDMILHMIGYNSEVNDGKRELKVMVNLLVNYGLMDIDEHVNLVVAE